MSFAPVWAFVAFSPLIVANVFQSVSLVLLPISERQFKRVNMVIAILVWSWWRRIVERLQGTKVLVEGDELPPGESAVVFANHQSMADIVVLLCLALRLGRVGDMRWMVKASMRFMPFLGWSMLALDFLFLKRDWAKDRARIEATFARLRGRDEPVWLVLFPEGTRRTPEKHAASMERAKRRGQATTAHVMLPRTKGFAASVQGLAGKISAVYRITVIYSGERTPSLYELFAGKVATVRLLVKRHPIACVPRDEAGVATWLHQEFVHMNEALTPPRPR